MSRRSSDSHSRSSASSFSLCPPATEYLVALYPYQPDSDHVTIDGAVCLALQPNTIIFVHSIHSSGWADGTLINGGRGWFPSNYCEPYTLSILRPLTEAKRSLSHLVRDRQVQEYVVAVSAVVTAVRQLLLDANCLTRDTAVLRQSESARRHRKVLLCELSELVNLTKRESLNLSDVGAELALRGERTLSRAGRFLHAVGQLSGLYAKEQSACFAITSYSSPPVSHDFSTLNNHEDTRTDIENGFENCNTSFAVPPQTLTEALDFAHDALVSIMTAYISRLRVQVQTQSANPILQATRQCVEAARALLAAFESVCSYYPDNNVIASKDLLYRHITRLVSCAREVVGSSDGVVFSTQPLIDAATGVVRGAGQCTARAKHLLDTKGDIRLDEKSCTALPRDNTSSTLNSIADARQNDEAQIEALAVPFKQVESTQLRDGLLKTKFSSLSLSAQRPSLSNTPSYSLPLSPVESNFSDSSRSQFCTSDLEVNLNHDCQIIGASLTSLIEALTPGDCTPDSQVVTAFFLTFRLFSSASRFAEMLVSRFAWTEDQAASDELWQKQTGMSIRLRVYNVCKGWLENHWQHDEDHAAIAIIREFAEKTLVSRLPQAAKRLQELCDKASETPSRDLPARNSTSKSRPLTIEVPAPPTAVSTHQLSILQEAASDMAGTKSCSVLDFDELEIARQFTLLESEMFCAIHPVELIGQEFAKKSNISKAINVKAMSAASTDLAGWVADTILSETEQKKRTDVLRHWIKIAERCLQLRNYNTLMAIMCALNSSTIARLKRTWDGIGKAQKGTLEHLRAVTDYQRNYAVYRSRIRESPAPCLPFLGLYLTDLTFIDEGNPNHRLSKSSDRRLINFDKYLKTSKVVTDLQRFQVAYKLKPVPELMEWLSASCLRMRSSSKDLSTALYRRSLILEPKTCAPMKREPSIASSVESDNKSESKSGMLSFLTNR